MPASGAICCRLLRCYATFFCAFTFAHLARCAAAIFLRADADMVRLVFILPVCFAALLAHRAFCARLIRLRAEADLQEIVDLDAAPDPSFDTGAVDAGVRLAE
jgi:hypothetical protein